VPRGTAVAELIRLDVIPEAFQTGIAITSGGCKGVCNLELFEERWIDREDRR